MPLHAEPWTRRVLTEVPGPQSRAQTDTLARHECPAITARRARRAHESNIPQDPIVWRAGRGPYIEDVDGNRFLDFTAAFAVSSYGHAHPELARAVSEQAARLMHGMGDVFPSDVKIAFAKRLAEFMPQNHLTQSIFGQSGAEAVEAALKTAAVFSGRRRVLAFHGSYHGLSLGALGVTAYKDAFRSPFFDHLPSRVSHAPYPYCYRCPLGLERGSCKLACLSYTRHLIENPASGAESVGAVILEPIQGRGGEVVPPFEWMEGLAALCQKHDLVLILDEIFTGFGRTGKRFAFEHFGDGPLRPDLVCMGKAMTGGFPMSAVMGSEEVMGAWGSSQGEAIHTSTFLGNPMGCAAGLKAIELMERHRYEDVSAALGLHLGEGLRRLQGRWPDRIGDVRGFGLMQGMELVRSAQTREPDGPLALTLTSMLLQKGILLLPSGAYGQVLAFSPPFVVTTDEIDLMLSELEGCLAQCLGG